MQSALHLIAQLLVSLPLAAALGWVGKQTEQETALGPHLLVGRGTTLLIMPADASRWRTSA